jgi:hypothetical protein
VVLGTGLIAWIMRSLDRRAGEDREAREALERSNERDRARHDLENQMRRTLLSSVLSAASELYLATQHYWRVKEDPSRTSEEAEARKAMDNQYRKSRAILTVSEVELEALFDTDEPSRLCHRIDDLLTVRYMQLIGKATARLYEKNALGYEGKEHSGLSASEMESSVRKKPNTLLASYRNALKELAPSVLRAPFRQGHWADEGLRRINQLAGAPPTATERWKSPTRLIGGIFVISVVLIGVSYLGDRSLDLREFSYDLGLGVGIATVVSLMVSVHLKQLDKLHEARHEAIRQLFEHAESVFEKRLGG